MSHADLIHSSIGLIVAIACGVLLVTMFVGVPCFLLYTAWLGKDASSQAIRRLNERLFWFAIVVLEVAFACVLLDAVIGACRGG